MKRWTRTALALACAGLLLTAGACSRQGEPVSTAPSSAVEATPTPSPSPTPSPIPSPSPTPEAESSQAPAGAFEAAFEENPIDRQLEEDLDLASSVSKIQRAYNDAASSWTALIDSAMEQAREVLEGEALDTLEVEQQAWETALDQSLEDIRTQNSEDGLAAAREIVEFYRARGQAICQAYFEAAGELPQFPEVGEGEPVG